MLGHDAEEDKEYPVTMPEKIMKVGHNAGKDKGCILENPKQNEGIESGRDA